MRKSDAAIVSRIGALATADLKPRLCSSSPEVSTESVQTSLSMRAMISMGAPSSGVGPSTALMPRAMRSSTAPEW